MDSNELREACEMAGLPVLDADDGDWTARYGYGDGNQARPACLWRDDPALPAYAAELLTAKVREQGKGALLAQELNALTDYAWSTTATAEQRTRACMAVLRGGR